MQIFEIFAERKNLCFCQYLSIFVWLPLKFQKRTVLNKPAPLEVWITKAIYPQIIFWLSLSAQYTEPVFVYVYGAQESIPRNRFRQPM